MPVPYTFATQTGNIALSELDANFANVKAAADSASLVTASAQPAITSVGQLTSLTVSGNIRTLSGGIYAPNYFYANGQPFQPGSSTSSYGNSNVAAYLPTYNGGLDNLGGNVTTTGVVNASVGIFSGRIQAGNISGAQFTTNGVINATRTITGGNISSNGFVSGLTVQATSGGITAVGNIAGGNITTAGNVVADQRLQATTVVATGQVQGSDLYSTDILRGANLIVSATAQISGVATVLNSTAAASTSQGALVVTGGLAVGKNAYFGGDGGTAITHTGDVIPSSTSTYNLGSSSLQYNIIYGRSTQASYADLAENYLADQHYESGTVLMFGGAAEVTQATSATQAVAGVVSKTPAHLMNSDLQGSHVTAVALQGRVWCQVKGRVRKGDLMISAGSGQACADNNARPGQTIGKALANFDGDQGVIEIVVGRV